MSSLRQRIDRLEADLTARPMQISVHSDLPFAIFRYDPGDEWEMRQEARLLAVRLGQQGTVVHQISLGELLWQSIDAAEDLEAVVEFEREHGFEKAQRLVTDYLSDPDFAPLRDAVTGQLSELDPARDLAFLARAAALSPAIYPVSRLLEELQGRTQVPAVLFYPGTIEGATGLNFMDLSTKEVIGNYRVRIY